MINLNQKYRFNCFFVSGSIDEIASFNDRMKGCYQIYVAPWGPDMKLDLSEAFEQYSPHHQVDTSEVFGPDDTLILESIIKPYAPDFPNQDEPHVGTSLRITIIPEIKTSSASEFVFPQLTIVGIDRYIDEHELIDWSKVSGGDYDW